MTLDELQQLLKKEQIIINIDLDPREDHVIVNGMRVGKRVGLEKSAKSSSLEWAIREVIRKVKGFV